MIRVEKVSKRFRDVLVLDSVELEVEDKTVVAILGPTGIGKTVLLKIMAGLLEPDRGRVWFDDRPLRYGMFANNLRTTGGLGYVFQGGALFDSMTVAENIALPLEECGMRNAEGGRQKRFEPSEVRRRVEEVLEKVGMTGTQGLYPKALSGGMTRLVAIARALVTDPRYLFFDEPTTGLDPALRSRIGNLIRSLRDGEGKTGVIVTHDLETARAVADRLYMLKQGRLMPAEQVRREDYEPTFC